ncbi:hypothetical protein PAPYR_6883 [Paratrimastix pyriformis]|uniref:Uncharacterized protein n=1 Tax=Paratrimastix pyriformis TaxID=342808 RepID=A0ABQ8UFT1_9EUKA|nr:hypothetical protein PAPYR_6883 [Paratrimastix pyriformis]
MCQCVDMLCVDHHHSFVFLLQILSLLRHNVLLNDEWIMAGAPHPAATAHPATATATTATATAAHDSQAVAPAPSPMSYPTPLYATPQMQYEGPFFAHPKVDVRMLDWRLPDPELGRFECIVASDVVYELACVEPLAAIIASTLAPHGHCYISIACNREGIPEFEFALLSSGLSFDYWSLFGRVKSRGHRPVDLQRDPSLKARSASSRSASLATATTEETTATGTTGGSSSVYEGTELVAGLCEASNPQDLEALAEMRGGSGHERGRGFRLYHIYHDPTPAPS